ncbi:putative Polycomb group protein ASXL3 [Microplitis mediator]|uniref:putative Polycomb group protein ASXL3 n=1 Tax=Microplitis mediator TaxID=375433 RepID=UPI002554D6A0|nr:putative Polycomb group protein ASXL3 [Microplitis mediator]
MPDPSNTGNATNEQEAQELTIIALSVSIRIAPPEIVNPNPMDPSESQTTPISTVPSQSQTTTISTVPSQSQTTTISTVPFQSQATTISTVPSQSQTTSMSDQPRPCGSADNQSPAMGNEHLNKMMMLINSMGENNTVESQVPLPSADDTESDEEKMEEENETKTKKRQLEDKEDDSDEPDEKKMKN